MIEIKTAELTGAALDWAVARATWKGDLNSDFNKLFLKSFRPSTTWAQTGQLVDEFKIWVSGPIRARKDWSAAVDSSTDEMRGPTALIAICRALVQHMLGDVVRVPAELVGVPS